MAGCMSGIGRVFSSKRRNSNVTSDAENASHGDLLSSSSTQKRFSESLLRHLSIVQTPELILQQQEAMVNLTFFNPIQQNTHASQASGFSGGYGRLKSMALLGGTGDGLQPRESTRFDWSVSRKALETAIALEQQTQRSGGGWEYGGHAALMLQEQLLTERLDKLRLDMHVMEGDGNCQFRSVSFALYGTQAHHAKVRQRAVDYMHRHKDDFELFLGEDFSSYMREMAKPRVWGDELTLRAICEAYGVVINVITSDRENWFLRYLPQRSRLQHEVFLTYISPVHYNAVRRRALVDLLRSFSMVRQQQGSRIMAALEEYEKKEMVPSNPQELVAVIGT